MPIEFTPTGSNVPPMAPITTISTAENAGTVDATYGAAEAAVINNLRTRLGEAESAINQIITALEGADIVRKN